MLPFFLSVITEKLVTSEPVPEVGGDSDQLGLGAQLGEIEGALTDIQEALTQTVEAGFGMLVEQPHTLGSVDGATTADGNDHVGIEGTHGFHAAHDALYAGIALNVGVDLAVAVLLTLTQVMQDLVHVAQLNHYGVSYDEGAVDTLHLLQVLDGIFLEIDLRGNLEATAY